MIGTNARLQSVFRAIGWRGALEALFHPVLVPVMVVLPLIRSLWAARVLLDGRWGDYHGFHPIHALNGLYYKTQWLNIERHGLNGTSPTLGLGAFRLSGWFYLSLLSSCLYGNGGAAVTLLGTASWAMLHSIWYWAIPWKWVTLIILVTFFSSTTYLMAFVRQNYNIIGWMWLPLGLFGILSNQLGLAAVAWFAASLGSTTAVFAVAPLVIGLAIGENHPYLLLTLVPAAIKFSLHFLPMIRGQSVMAGVTGIAKLIGVSGRGAKYKRNLTEFNPVSLYFLVIYAVACGLIWYDHGEPPALVIAALATFVVNQYLVRFADIQSMIILFVSAAAATVMVEPSELVALAGLVLAANPIPAALGGGLWRSTHSVVRPPVVSPFDHSELHRAMSAFLEVPTGSRVLFAFDDPGDDYAKIFDGYRLLMELPLLVASEKGVHLMPDWYAVTETNYPDAPSFWGRDPDAVRANMARWDADRVIVYQDSGTELDPAWSSGYKVIATFDWGEWATALGSARLWATDRPPKWWLLEPKHD